MLEAIADFWKPVKKLQASARLKPEELQIGSIIGFGFVPQPTLSGRRLTVTGINTYKFGPDILTSFVLSQENDTGAAMIVAETEGEQYIAISRRVPVADRAKIFNAEDIEAVVNREEVKSIESKEVSSDYKGWIASRYNRQIHDVKGQLYKGDHRGGIITGQKAMDFRYTLLVSDNNEHALEIEKHEDGRLEVYATVYRRMSDIGEVTHPARRDTPPRPEVKLISDTKVDAPSKFEPKLEAKDPAAVKDEKAGESFPQAKAPIVEQPVENPPSAPEVRTEEAKKEDVMETVESTPFNLPEFSAEAVAQKQEEAAPEVEADMVWPEAKADEPPAARISASYAAETKAKPSVIIQSNNQPFITQEIKAVNKDTSNFVNESVDCELHVANKIIDEAIRNEMRINDVVRRVIGLPVSQQESVQIPITLTDQDYALLAIRYGLQASDQEAIKKRIIEDLGDFSGKKKAA